MPGRVDRRADLAADPDLVVVYLGARRTSCAAEWRPSTTTSAIDEGDLYSTDGTNGRAV